MTVPVGTVVQAELKVDPSFASTHQIAGFLKLDSGWVDVGTTEIDPSGVTTVPAAYTQPGVYELRIVVEEIPLQSLGFSIFALSDSQVMSRGLQALELTIIVTGAGLTLTPPPTSAPIYDGPLVENAPLSITTAGGELTYRGKKLESVSKVVAAGKELRLVSTSASSFTVIVPVLAAGTYSVTITSDYGQLTTQDALVVAPSIPLYKGPGSFVTRKISDTEIKVYAKDILGLGKVQFFVNGKEIAWARAVDATDPKLRILNKNQAQIPYLVRTISLKERVRIEIRVEGQRAKFATYNPAN
jgi:hypothetical protein